MARLFIPGEWFSIALQMTRDLQSDGAENSADNNSDEDAYKDVPGEALRCPKCDEYVALHYLPHSEYPGHRAGFVVECECAMGPQLDVEAVEGMHPPWFAETVDETEERSDEWMEYYLHDNRDTSRWTVDGA